MREEPVLYINGNPYVVREANKPFANLEYTGKEPKVTPHSTAVVFMSSERWGWLQASTKGMSRQWKADSSKMC